MSSLAEQIKLRRAATSERKQVCYSVKDGIASVRIRDGSKVWILPWMHHLFSSREEDKFERLLLTFVSHEVSITGYNLEALEEGIALHRVEKLRHMPANYVPTAGSDSIVTKIEVRPRSEEKKGPKALAEDSGSPNE